MPFLPPDNSEERILVFGSAGSGKSYIWAGIAQMYERTNTEGRFWIIDNDHGAKRMLREFPEVRDRVKIYTPRSFDDYRGINDEILDEAEENDWIVIDLISNVWEMLPGWWMEKVYGEDSWDYWVNARREVVEASQKGTSAERSFAGAASVDWQFIKKAYSGWEKPLTLNAPCHVLALAAEKEVVGHFDKSGEKSARYAMTNGMAPVGEKLSPHRFHTEMRIAKIAGKRPGSVIGRQLTVVKDRNREQLWAEHGGRGLTLELRDGPKFALDYLKRIGGWGIVRGEN